MKVDSATRNVERRLAFTISVLLIKEFIIQVVDNTENVFNHQFRLIGKELESIKISKVSFGFSILSMSVTNYVFKIIQFQQKHSLQNK